MEQTEKEIQRRSRPRLKWTGEMKSFLQQKCAWLFCLVHDAYFLFRLFPQKPSWFIYSSFALCPTSCVWCTGAVSVTHAESNWQQSTRARCSLHRKGNGCLCVRSSFVHTCFQQIGNSAHVYCTSSTMHMKPSHHDRFKINLTTNT